MRCSIAMGWRPSRFVYADYLQGGVFFSAKRAETAVLGAFGDARPRNRRMALEYPVSINLHRAGKEGPDVLSDIEIAQSVTPEHISAIAERAGVPEKYLEMYGSYKAKVDYNLLLDEKHESGKLILVTAINPTPAGEGNHHDGRSGRRHAQDRQKRGRCPA